MSVLVAVVFTLLVSALTQTLHAEELTLVGKCHIPRRADLKATLNFCNKYATVIWKAGRGCLFLHQMGNRNGIATVADPGFQVGWGVPTSYVAPTPHAPIF